MANTLDRSGTAFYDNVYVYTEDQLAGLSTETGSTFKFETEQDAQWLFFDARFTSPLLYGLDYKPEGWNAITATGDVTTEAGTTLSFNEADMSFSDAIVYQNQDGSTFWLMKVTDASGQSVYISDYVLKSSDTYQVSYHVEDPNLYGYDDAGNPSVVPPNAPTSRSEASLFRIDNTGQPGSPAHLENPTNTDEPGFMMLRAYDVTDFTTVTGESENGGIPNGAGTVFKLNEEHDAGSFRSYDNDTYISDGSNNYSAFGNDVTQIGDYILEDGTVVFEKEIYQAERGIVFELPDGTLAKGAIISFGGTFSDRQLFFTSEPIDPGIEYQMITGDGTPGLDNGNQIEISFKYGDLIPCFVGGTMIATDEGEKPIEELKAGDRVWTKAQGFVPIRWINSSYVSKARLVANEALRPIIIRKGSLGKNHPSQDLKVSRQHRMVISSRAALRLEGVQDVLIPAKDLLDLEGVESDNSCEAVEYFHIMFDDHQIVQANGSLSESLFAGPDALRAVSPECRAELIALFPELADPDTLLQEPAMNIVQGSLARRIVAKMDMI